MPSSHLILSSPSSPAFNLSQNQGLFLESTLRMRWPKYWSFSFSIRPSKEHSGLISFRMDRLNLLAVQGTLKSLLQAQFKSINSSALSSLHSPTVASIRDQWTIALTRRTFIGKYLGVYSRNEIAGSCSKFLFNILRNLQLLHSSCLVLHSH